ncbi:Bacterial PH domain protein [uncultured archaeon]|nr:Bacterial PH domain protein [uncultured archaeon]
MADPAALRHLDSKVKLVWFLPQAALLLLIWLLALAALFVFGASPPMPGLTSPVFAFFLLLFEALFIAAPVYAYHHIEYMSFTYEMGEKEFIVRQGVFTRETTVIPYERIQNVNTRRTLLERFLGLATLEIDTAGSNPNMAEGVLPGVSNKDALIREMMDRVERAKAGHASADGLGARGTLPSERQLLADILKELVQLKHLLQHNPASRGPPDFPKPGGHPPLGRRE